jgi:ribose transport system permease protein
VTELEHSPTDALEAGPQPQAATTATWRITGRRMARAQDRVPLLQLLALGAAFAYGAVTLPGLATWSSIESLLVLGSLVGLASVGQTLLILMGGFDLSISGFIVAGALIVTEVGGQWHVPVGVALLIAVAAAAALGGAAGYVCHRYQIQPLIVTLGTGTIALGLVQAQTGGALAGSAPNWLTQLTIPIGHTFGIGIPPVVVIWVLVAILLTIFLHRTVVGRRLLATGANPRAAGLALVRTRRIWTLTFAISGAASALVGVLIAGFNGSVDSTIGDPYLFQSVVAVIVGGTLFGGPGDYIRTVIGALFMTMLTTDLVGHGATMADEDIVYGLAILAAVAVYGRQRRIADRV